MKHRFDQCEVRPRLTAVSMQRLHKIRLVLALSAVLAAMQPICTFAQDDPNEPPLGDVARSLRKKTPPAQGIIDDDNFSQVMNEAESRRPSGSALKFLMNGEGKGFLVSAPDVTCSLSFSANAKTLLSSQYAQMELPASEMEKLEGPATIEGDALTVSVTNGTDWHVSEVSVALTVVKKGGAKDASLSDGTIPGSATYGSAKLIPAVADNVAQESAQSEVRPEKKPDVTLIYRMRAAAPPFTKTVFSAPLNLELAPGEEWHWAIVQARGYPPQSYAAGATHSPRTSEAQPVVPPSLLVPQDSDATPLPLTPQ